MSKRTANNNDNVEVTIIRTSDGCKRKFQMSLSTNTLTTLKQQINSDPQLGPLPPNQQRLFHLGREIKSSNRSLEALGIGKFRVFTVHLHALVTCLELLDSDVEEEVGVKRRGSSANGTANRSNSDDDDDDDEVVDMTTPDVTARFEAERARRRSNNNGDDDDRQASLKQRNDEVVDLLDSSDDDDDDVVEIVECTTSSGSKRRRRN